MSEVYLCIHGHFYQPPRENPWTNEIDDEPSAAPFHNWNERIYSECYLPNSEAGIYENYTTLIREVNNYELLNFNFGPTLFNWIKEKHLNLYHRIIDADKKSVERRHGHGNAIAQVYNHIIMPLANLRDKLTQIKWGLRDFELNFNRRPEGMWLAETACDYETIEVLIHEGIKYIILDSSQAESVRSIGERRWHDVSDNSIDTKRPYRCYSQLNHKKHIDIFFYDGPLSKTIAFEDLLNDAGKLLERINASRDNNRTEPQLISIATDGETFGHHKKFADRTIAYLLSELAPQNGIKICNYGEYLKAHPPKWEAKIKKGPEGLGTSWSCLHGVKRWKENCGCTTGGEQDWNQKWRTPLRDSLNWLRDECAKVFEAEGNKYLKDVWSARNDYIDLMHERSHHNIIKFFARHGRVNVDNKGIELVFKLLEMEKYSLLMFSSCGWFFSDIAGLEAMQILKYACRTLEYLNDITGVDYEESFLAILKSAIPNDKKYPDAAIMYLKEIKPLAGKIKFDYFKGII